MALRTLEAMQAAGTDLAGRRVLLRADLDVPLTPARGIADPWKVEAALPTLRYCLERGARVIVASHLGPPRGKGVPELSLEPVAAALAEALSRDVVLADEAVGDGARKVVSDVRDGGVAVLENLRSAPSDEGNEDAFARTLGSYADVFVNDAFSLAHKATASTVGVARFVAERAAGLAFEREVKALRRLQTEAEKPYVVIVGGIHVPEKLRLVESLFGRATTVFVAGAVGNTLLKARGLGIGRSLSDEDKVAAARGVLRRADERGTNLMLPADVVVGAGTRAEAGRVVAARSVPEDLAILDLGPESVRRIADALARARTVLWLGAVGVAESPPFAAGTTAVAQAVAATYGAFTFVAGQHQRTALREAGLMDRISHVSSGSAAALELLAGTKLPALVALEA